jgi:hypothetical protein
LKIYKTFFYEFESTQNSVADPHSFEVVPVAATGRENYAAPNQTPPPLHMV